ncbi:MAG: [FeFe] hydrogenase H-cluster maturation GTPase HydF [Ruminococcaceae bacterium]|nr:[FeFe] hydrogenase H-cluster maturation GTPase HydF [Oscillospiraceae bacterium]
MSLNEKVSAERLHIAFFGLRNAGKSSVVNAITNQSLSVVSEVKGTTTDPVKKAMELLPIGPVVIIDTAGIDDEGELGELRIEKTRKILNKTDIAILVIDASKGKQQEDSNLIEDFKKRNIPYIVAFNKCDLITENKKLNENEIYVSAKENININELKELIGKLSNLEKEEKTLLGDIINSGDTVVLVTPIDSSAPKGRLILPQQQTIRELLDIGATVVVTKDSELKETLSKFKNQPRLVITDSQAFKRVNEIVPANIALTSFSILFARYKGELWGAVSGADKLDELQDGDYVLISEGCTHHRQCGDIGTEKLPNWIKNYTKKDINFDFTSGSDFPEDLKKYKLIIHCGACMLTEREMKTRISLSNEQQIPISNYGIIIAKINGILERATAPLRK